MPSCMESQPLMKKQSSGWGILEDITYELPLGQKHEKRDVINHPNKSFFFYVLFFFFLLFISVSDLYTSPSSLDLNFLSAWWMYKCINHPLLIFLEINATILILMFQWIRLAAVKFAVIESQMQYFPVRDLSHLLLRWRLILRTKYVLRVIAHKEETKQQKQLHFNM